MSYVEPIEEAGLSSKEKALKRSRGLNFYPIITKRSKFVGHIKLCVKISYVTLIRVAGLSSNEISFETL